WLSLLPSLPDLFTGPAPRPFERGQRMPRGRALWRPDLEHVLHLETVRAKQADPVAVPEVELDAGVVGPGEPVHPEVVADELLPSRAVDLEIGHGEHQQHAVGQKDQLAARAQYTSGLGNPPVGIAPEAGAVLADREIEARRCEGDRFRIGVNQRELDPELALEAQCGRQL